MRYKSELWPTPHHDTLWRWGLGFVGHRSNILEQAIPTYIQVTPSLVTFKSFSFYNLISLVRALLKAVDLFTLVMLRLFVTMKYFILTKSRHPRAIVWTDRQLLMCRFQHCTNMQWQWYMFASACIGEQKVQYNNVKWEFKLWWK